MGELIALPQSNLIKHTDGFPLRPQLNALPAHCSRTTHDHCLGRKDNLLNDPRASPPRPINNLQNFPGQLLRGQRGIGRGIGELAQLPHERIEHHPEQDPE